jgi:hypothetical protein
MFERVEAILIGRRSSLAENEEDDLAVAIEGLVGPEGFEPPAKGL